MKEKVTIIYNPVSGKASPMGLSKAHRLLGQAGYDPDIRITNKRGDAEEFAKEAVKSKPEFVLAAGGDGTIAEVVNGLAGSGVALAVLPLGTANVLAKELEVPETIEGAINIAINGKVRSASLGKITTSEGTRLFALMAGFGYDAETVYRVNTDLKKWKGKAAYVLSALVVMFRGKQVSLTVNIDGISHECDNLIVSNTNKYAGDFNLAPHANITEPGFVLTMLKGSGFFKILAFTLAMSFGAHKGLGFVSQHSGREVVVNGNCHIQVDGDYLSKGPATISAVENVLRLRY